MTVYNTATAGDVSPGYYYNDGTKWIRIGSDGDYWKTTGNAGTNPGTNPLNIFTPADGNYWGTSDAQNLVVGVNGSKMAMFDQKGNFFGNGGYNGIDPTQSTTMSSIIWAANSADSSSQGGDLLVGSNHAINPRTMGGSIIGGNGNRMITQANGVTAQISVGSTGTLMMGSYNTAYDHGGSNIYAGAYNNDTSSWRSIISGFYNQTNGLGNGLLIGNNNILKGNGNGPVARMLIAGQYLNTEFDINSISSFNAGGFDITSGSYSNHIYPLGNNITSGASNTDTSSKNSLLFGNTNKVYGLYNGFVGGMNNNIKAVGATGGSSTSVLVMGGDNQVAQASNAANAGAVETVLGQYNTEYNGINETILGQSNTDSNGRNNLIAGTINKAVNIHNSFITGYQNSLYYNFPNPVNGSAVFGHDNIDSANATLVAGSNNVVSPLMNNATVVGHNNKPVDYSLFQIGNGNDSNAVTVMDQGQPGIMGVGVNTPTNALHVAATADPLRLQGLQSGAITDSVLTSDATGVVRQLSASSVAALADLRLVGTNNHITQDAGVGSTGTSAGSGGNNILIGSQSGNAITTGDDNIGIGRFALQNNQTGSNNTAIGRHALRNNTGTSNTAIGAAAAVANTTGTRLVAVGERALNANTTGNDNTAIGSAALRDNTTGAGNIAMGRNALDVNTTGNDNTALGNFALTASNGDQNVAVGNGALQLNTTGVANAAVGFQASHDNTVGNNNTSFGRQAAYKNTTGSSNIALGYQALFDNVTGSRNTAIGQFALGDNTVSDNVAIGQNAMKINTTGTTNTAVGVNALLAQVTGNSNTALGLRAGQSNNVGNQNTFLGTQAGNDLTSGDNNIFIGYNTNANISATGSNQLNIGDWIYGNNGKIGLGKAMPAARLHVVKVVGDLTPAVIEGCNDYADNAAAISAGLPVGALYRTGDALKVVH